MNKPIDTSHEPDLGYIFYPEAMESLFGGTRFDVILHEQPTLRHYDPKSVQTIIAVDADNTDIIHIYYSTPPDHFRVCAGRILIADRIGKRVEVFCFGGTLDIIQKQQENICVFQSPAPFLDLRALHTIDMLFASEVEILIAERRAAWDPAHPHEFMQHMAQADPAALYIACLHKLATKFTASTYANLSDPMYHQFIHDLHQEIERWQQDGRWLAMMPELADLL